MTPRDTRITEALERNGGNRAATARELGMSPSTIYSYLWSVRHPADYHESRRRSDRRRARARRVAAAVDVWAPRCMSADEWSEWRRLNPMALALGDMAYRPCADCPGAWADEQRLVGRCNGKPGVVA